MKHISLSLMAFFLMTACESTNSKVTAEGDYIARNGQVSSHVNKDFEHTFYQCMKFMGNTLQAKITSSSKSRAVIVGELGDGYKVSLIFDKKLESVTGVTIKATRYGVTQNDLASQISQDLMPTLY